MSSLGNTGVRNTGTGTKEMLNTIHKTVERITLTKIMTKEYRNTFNKQNDNFIQGKLSEQIQYSVVYK